MKSAKEIFNERAAQLRDELPHVPSDQLPDWNMRTQTLLIFEAARLMSETSPEEVFKGKPLKQ